jgi:hypothetical protein
MTKIISQGIPQRIIRDTQSFQLVAMIEGAAANTQFINNLQVLGQQRQLLADLEKKIAALPPTATTEERSTLKAQHIQLDAQVSKNLEFMTKHYGYSVKHNYLLSPVYSMLLRKAADDKGQPIEDESKATLVAELRTAEAYDELQYLRSKVGALASDASKKDELEATKATLKEKFDFDLNGHYILQVRKGALYATVEN